VYTIPETERLTAILDKAEIDPDTNEVTTLRRQIIRGDYGKASVRTVGALEYNDTRYKSMPQVQQKDWKRRNAEGRKEYRLHSSDPIFEEIFYRCVSKSVYVWYARYMERMRLRHENEARDGGVVLWRIFTRSRRDVRVGDEPLAIVGTHNG
jgi:hypothetical protein